MSLSISSFNPAALFRASVAADAAKPVATASTGASAADVDDNWCGTTYPHKFGPHGPGVLGDVTQVLRGGSLSAGGSLAADFDDNWCGTPYPGKFGPHGPGVGPQSGPDPVTGPARSVLIGL